MINPDLLIYSCEKCTVSAVWMIGLHGDWHLRGRAENLLINANIFLYVWLRGSVLTRVIGRSGRASVSASSTVCLTNRLFSQNTLSPHLSVSRVNRGPGSCGFSRIRLSHRIKTLISNVQPCVVVFFFFL